MAIDVNRDQRHNGPEQWKGRNVEGANGKEGCRSCQEDTELMERQRPMQAKNQAHVARAWSTCHGALRILGQLDLIFGS